MKLTPEVWAVVFAGLAFILGLLIVRQRSKRTRSVGRKIGNVPANLRFSCAGCSQQFTHSRRTLGAWERGARRFYCNACHTKWQGAQSIRGPSAEVLTRGSVEPPPSGGAAKNALQKSGCLGVIVLLLGLPAAVAFGLMHWPQAHARASRATSAVLPPAGVAANRLMPPSPASRRGA